MKNVVFLDDLKESDIRPEKIYEEYRRLLSDDIKECFSDPSLLVKVDCPGCSGKDSKFAFSKMGLDYCSCGECSSLFVSPRPAEDALKKFYKESKSCIFLRESLLAGTFESRFEKVFSYRIQWITDLAEEYLPEAQVLLDYATKYPFFLKQVQSADIFKSIIAVLPQCCELLPENICVLNSGKFRNDGADMFTAFEVIEKIFDPVALFDDAYAACRKDGLFVVTSATSSGFEYKVLGEHSPNIIPIDRLNLLSLEALIGRIKEAGFEIVEVSTPGRLDVEIVKRAYEKDPGIPKDPFWQYLFSKRSANALHSLQEYLQQYQLSSHVRIAAIKR